MKLSALRIYGFLVALEMLQETDPGFVDGWRFDLRDDGTASFASDMVSMLDGIAAVWGYFRPPRR